MTSCDCPKPPGGKVRCSAGQIAFCCVDAAGNVEGGCIDPPKRMGQVVLGLITAQVVNGKVMPDAETAAVLADLASGVLGERVRLSTAEAQSIAEGLTRSIIDKKEAAFIVRGRRVQLGLPALAGWDATPPAMESSS